ncbi:Ldh family oxidoreductase [Thermodesulfobacteriota bacterium]
MTIKMGAVILKNYRADKISILLSQLFLRVGVKQEDAVLIANSLVDSNLCGYDSHGVLRTPHYVERFSNGTTNVSPNITFKQLSPGAAILDGDHGAGQIVAHKAMGYALNLAKESGVGCVAAYRSNHFGRAAYFTAQAVNADMIGLAMTHTDANTLPYGGTRPYLGSNALAFSAPTDKDFPLVIDLSMTAISFGKIYEANLKGTNILPNCACDESGAMTTDPKNVCNLYPAAGYKGYGLSIMIEVLCAMLTGNPFAHYLVDMYDQIDLPRELGHFFMAIEIKRFRDVDAFKKDMAQMIDDLHGIPPQNGFDSVKVPGELEYYNMQERKKHGIMLPQALIESLRELAVKYQVEFPKDALIV